MKSVPETIRPKIQVRTALDYLVEKAEKLGMTATAGAIKAAIEVATKEISDENHQADKKKEG